MATHRGRLRGNFHLTGSCRENRPAILILEQSVGSALHMEHLFRVRADTAEQTEAGLDKKWPLDETLLPEIVQIMEVARVVAFELVELTRFVQLLARGAVVCEVVAEEEGVAPPERP